MSQSTERIERFKAEVADMRVRDPATGRDVLFGRLGAVAMVVGVGVTIGAWFVSHGTTSELQQRDAIVQAIAGLAVALVGAALFVKASLAGFLRFWMARLCYEQQAQADRLAEAIAPATPTNTTGAPHAGGAPNAGGPTRADSFHTT